MSTLRSALTELREEPLESVTDWQLHDDLIELSRQAAVLESERLRRVAEMDARSSYETDDAATGPPPESP